MKMQRIACNLSGKNNPPELMHAMSPLGMISDAASWYSYEMPLPYSQQMQRMIPYFFTKGYNFILNKRTELEIFHRKKNQAQSH